jgi:hypothetical protein
MMGPLHIEELQALVSQLPADEFDRFSQWFEEFLAKRWDRQIEADILAGRLDAAGRRADKEIEGDRCTPLHPQLMALFEQSRQSHRDEGGISIEQLRRELDLEPDVEGVNPDA